LEFRLQAAQNDLNVCPLRGISGGSSTKNNAKNYSLGARRAVIPGIPRRTGPTSDICDF
jgi:hypothetical protein